MPRPKIRQSSLRTRHNATQPMPRIQLPTTQPSPPNTQPPPHKHSAARASGKHAADETDSPFLVPLELDPSPLTTTKRRAARRRPTSNVHNLDDSALEDAAADVSRRLLMTSNDWQ